jgi:hypothetical protein
VSRRAVVLATTRDLPEPDHDEAATLAALRASGLDVRVEPWEAGAPEDADLVILRSTWNYIHRLEEFLAWCAAVGERLVNPPSVVRWNADKRYLLELERAGHFQKLAAQMARARFQQPRRLHGEGGTARDHAPRAHPLRGGARQGERVHARMAMKAPILGGDQHGQEMRRHIRGRRPFSP